MHTDTEHTPPSSLQALLESQAPLPTILSQPRILTSIKMNMGLFLRYCHSQPEATPQLIAMAVEWASLSQLGEDRSELYNAANIISSDNDLVADLLIPSVHPSAKQPHSDSDDEIGEEIEAEIENNGLYCEEPEKQFANLQCLLVHLKHSPAQTTVNFMSKVLTQLVDRKATEILTFLCHSHEHVEVLAGLSYYPSLGRCLAKLIASKQDASPVENASVKQQILSCILLELQQSADDPQSIDTLQFIDELLHASRFSDTEERSPLQLLSDQAVSRGVLSFHLNKVMSILELLTQIHYQLSEQIAIYHRYSLSIGYLGLVASRINDDDESYGDTPGSFEPTLNYQADQIYHAFCGLVTKMHSLTRLTLLSVGQRNCGLVKSFELLIEMTKHSRFEFFYSSTPVEVRESSAKALVTSIAEGCYRGVVESLCLKVLQLMLKSQTTQFQEQKGSIRAHALASSLIDCKRVEMLFEEREKKKRETNCLQGVACVRKMVMIIDNYAHESQDRPLPTFYHRFPQYQTLTNSYLDTGCVPDHPAGRKQTLTSELKFMAQSQQNRAKRETATDLSNKISRLDKVESGQGSPFLDKLNEKIMTFKERNSKKSEKDDSQLDSSFDSLSSASESEGLEGVLTPPKRRERERKVGSPQSPLSPGLAFFVRHLSIY